MTQQFPLPDIYSKRMKTHIGTLKNYMNVGGSINHDSKKGSGDRILVYVLNPSLVHLKLSQHW